VPDSCFLTQIYRVHHIFHIYRAVTPYELRIDECHIDIAYCRDIPIHEMHGPVGQGAGVRRGGGQGLEARERREAEGLPAGDPHRGGREGPRSPQRVTYADVCGSDFDSRKQHSRKKNYS